MIMTHLDPVIDADEYAGLLAEAANGSSRRLEPLIAQFSPMLWRVVRAQGVDAVTAEDVIQNTWLSLLKSVDKIENPKALAGWLATTARREAWRTRKRDVKEQPVEREWDNQIADQVDIDDDVLERAEIGPRYRSLWKAVDELPDKCRELIKVIAYVDRPDYNAVSAALGMPRNSIGPNRGRCLTKLRNALNADARWND